MMATILNSSILKSAILDSGILHKTLPQTSSIWLKLIHSLSIWWWQPSWILPSWIQPFCTKENLTHSFWLNLMIAAILNTALHMPRFSSQHLDSFWLNLMIAAILKSANSAILDKKILHSFILTQLDDGSHLEFCHLEFDINLMIADKKYFTHSFWLNLMAAIEFCHLEFGHLGLSHLSFSSQTHSHLPGLVTNICTKKLHSFILTQLDDCSYLEICHPRFSYFVQKDTSLIHSDKLMMEAILNSAMLDSDTAILDWDTLLSSLRFTQKHSHSILTQTHSFSLWLKLIHSDSNSFILT